MRNAAGFDNYRMWRVRVSMGKINPIVLKGLWKEGYALDYHSLSSEYIGVDQWGHDRYETTRSDIGQLIYDLKYKGNITKVDEIIELIAPFLTSWDISNIINCIIPIPPSKKEREFQPVIEISKKISALINKPVLLDVIEKNSSTQSKDLGSAEKNKIAGSISKNRTFKKSVSILLIDDLYQTGRTLDETIRVLKTDPNVQNIYVLTMTKTRR